MEKQLTILECPSKDKPQCLYANRLDSGKKSVLCKLVFVPPARTSGEEGIVSTQVKYASMVIIMGIIRSSVWDDVRDTTSGVINALIVSGSASFSCYFEMKIFLV